jgi:K+-sensing histidine kinase KdpD
MRLVGRAGPTLVSLAIILAVTVVLARLKLAQQGPQHLVFFYLAPTAFVAILYGSVLSLLCDCSNTHCGVLSLRSHYSFYVADPHEIGELFLFAIVGLLGAKSMAALMRSPQKPF